MNRMSSPTISSVGPNPSRSDASSEVVCTVDCALIWTSCALEQRGELVVVPERRDLGREQRRRRRLRSPAG